VSRTWLPPIEAGVTTRTGVREALGEPSARFEGGRIEIYRFIIAEGPDELSDIDFERRIGPLLAEQFSDSTLQAHWRARRNAALDAAGALRIVTADLERAQPRQIVASPVDGSVVIVYGMDDVVARHAVVLARP
jgi:hypothetical protein